MITVILLLLAGIVAVTVQTAADNFSQSRFQTSNFFDINSFEIVCLLAYETSSSVLTCVG